MRLYDTHCHFETTDETAIRATLERARDAGVAALMAVGGSDSLNSSAVAARRVAAGDRSLPRVALAVGFDREQLHVTDFSGVTTAQGIAAVGEIGLDYHYSPETREAQMKLFAAQLRIARDMDLPVVIHTREADDDTLALLRQIPSRGIIHCYTGAPEAARAFLDLGFYISISGIVTFRAAENVRKSAAAIPDDRLLVETDSPFLAPVPMRGKANEPAFVAHTCAFLAKERGISPEALSELTFANAERILGRIVV